MTAARFADVLDAFDHARSLLRLGVTVAVIRDDDGAYLVLPPNQKPPRGVALLATFGILARDQRAGWADEGKTR